MGFTPHAPPLTSLQDLGSVINTAVSVFGEDALLLGMDAPGSAARLLPQRDGSHAPVPALFPRRRRQEPFHGVRRRLHRRHDLPRAVRGVDSEPDRRLAEFARGIGARFLVHQDSGATAHLRGYARLGHVQGIDFGQDTDWEVAARVFPTPLPLSSMRQLLISRLPPPPPPPLARRRGRSASFRGIPEGGRGGQLRGRGRTGFYCIARMALLPLSATYRIPAVVRHPYGIVRRARGNRVDPRSSYTGRRPRCPGTRLPRQGGDRRAGQDHLAHGAVIGVRDVEVRAVGGQAQRAVEAWPPRRSRPPCPETASCPARLLTSAVATQTSRIVWLP